MSFETIKRGELEFFRAADLGAVNGFSARSGGVSEGCLARLNLGFGRGDARENVLENWRRFGEAAGFAPDSLVLTNQVHGTLVRAVTRADCGQGLERPAPECDGLMTDEPGVALAVFSADCTPILLADERTGAVAAVHSGWRGTAKGIVRAAVEGMSAAYGSRPEELRAAIGPCIGRCCFETRSDVPEAMRAALGEDAAHAIDDHGDGTYHVDLKELNLLWLRRAGVERVEVCPLCTACNPGLFWSYRRAGGARGSLAAVVVGGKGR